MLADLVDLHDVRVLQPGDRLGLDLEAQPCSGAGVPPARIILRATRRFGLDLPGLVDDAHAAAAQFSEDLVAGHRSGVVLGGR